MTVFVVGAGWYGCHVAMELIKHNHTVYIVDKANAFFTGSSAKNQNRLHLGYHYPRSDKTIQECQRGFTAFKAAYPTLSTAIPNNLYLIASSATECLTDVGTFSREFDHPGELLCVNGHTPFSSIRGIKPTMFTVAEEFIDNRKAAAHFQQRLAPHFIHLPPVAFTSIATLRTVLEAGSTDWIINCTYNQLEPIAMDHYELYCSMVYHIPSNSNSSSNPFAITIMDGPFFSIYPYDLAKQLYTVTSVRHGVVWRGTVLQEAPATLLETDVQSLRAQIETDVSNILPDFSSIAYYHSHFLAWKTKPVTLDDDRSLRFHADTKTNTISLYGGKITGIFEAGERVLDTLEKMK